MRRKTGLTIVERAIIPVPGFEFLQFALRETIFSINSCI